MSGLSIHSELCALVSSYCTARMASAKIPGKAGWTACFKMKRTTQVFSGSLTLLGTLVWTQNFGPQVYFKGQLTWKDTY